MLCAVGKLTMKIQSAHIPEKVFSPRCICTHAKSERSYFRSLSLSHSAGRAVCCLLLYFSSQCQNDNACAAALLSGSCSICNSAGKGRKRPRQYFTHKAHSKLRMHINHEHRAALFVAGSAHRNNTTRNSFAIFAHYILTDDGFKVNLVPPLA